MTIDDIARELNISKTTVSRALSGKGRISDSTRNRVMSYANDVNYKPSAIAQSLATSRTMNIGFAMPSDYDIVDMPFFQTCLWGVTSMAMSMDRDVFISMVDAIDISGIIRLVENHKVDGMLLGRTYSDDKAIAYLKDMKIPFVTIGSSGVPGVVQVDNNDYEGCAELTSILLLKGLKRLALIGGNSTYIVNNNRLNGFLDGHRRAQVKPDESLIFMDSHGSFVIDKIVAGLLEGNVDCIIGMDDAICESILTALFSRDVRIPEDIKVASFFNSSLLEHHQPQVTSLKYNVEKLGMTACSTLLDVIEERSTVMVTLLDYEVAIKESTKIM
ncbi:MAG: LacI family DNA-binding transcriptional regulator [Lachnospiraceae bacterium]|nr:LacI family DNA-binding transcriptional regulator [Lachnospiraceae bacterium]MBQ8948101.1 LacI family DNA-binding transcriptional regulator [Lachnospiraceae bacterium]